MKTLIDLANEIQNDPKNVLPLLASFRTTSSEVRSFLFSLHDVPPYIVPALLRTFALNHRETEPKIIKDLIDSNKHLGAMFVLLEDGSDWTYQGVSSSGKALCRPFNSPLLMEISSEKEIKYVF